jgi:hypothetical protein
LLGSGEPKRAPLLERLLACADECTLAADWRADAFAVLAPGTPMPAVAPLALRSADMVQSRAPAAESWAAGSWAAESWAAVSWVCLATPVHYLAEIGNVRLAADGMLTLNSAEAAALALDFNRLWSGAGVQMWAAAARVFCGFDAALEVVTQDPERVRGRHLENFLPAGPDGARLRRLMSEMEMWLFDHAVNESRRRASHPPISGLWLWGGGAPLASLPAVQGGAAGEDLLVQAFPASADRIADVMVAETVPGSEAWHELESRWFQPTLIDLRRGRITRLELSAGERRYALSPRWRRRFWRRVRPWPEYFES